MVIDVDCSQSIRSLERSILGFPRPSAPYFIVRQNSLPDGNTSDILRNASQVNCPTLHYTVSTLQSEVLENAKSCLTWDGKSANGGAKSGEMYCTFSRHGHAIQLKPASAQLGFIFNFVFPSIFCPSRPSTQTAQMPNWCKIQTTMELTKDLMALSALLYWLVSRDRLLNPNCLCKQIRVHKEIFFPGIR